MTRSLLYFSISALLFVSACAKSPKAANNSQELFQAWISVHHPDAQPTSLGAYIVEDQPGSGELIGDATQSKYLRVNYTTSSLDGKVSSSTSETVAKQIGAYDERMYFGPRIWDRVTGKLYVGVEDAIKGMRVGGRRKAAIPGWLLTTEEYTSTEEYLKKVSGSNVFYDMEVLEVIDDIGQWEIDSLSRYLAINHPEIDPADSLDKYGFYYIQERAPLNTHTFPTDTVVYINYTGRLLNGKVFDTTIQDTAKLYGLYSPSRTYAPIEVNWNEEDHTKISLSSDKSSVVEGFSYGLFQMHAEEKATFIFYSELGYKKQGSTGVIPEFSPLIFEVEIVSNQ